MGKGKMATSLFFPIFVDYSPHNLKQGHAERVRAKESSVKLVKTSALSNAVSLAG